MRNTLRYIGCLLLITANFAFADSNHSVEFFASNNTNTISIQTAYNRLTGKEQRQLQSNIISVLQKHHIEQGEFEHILGTYLLQDQSITADNTDHFNSSPNQHLSDREIFSIAQELANILNQESIAVLIPTDAKIGEITVSFTSQQPRIEETIKLLHDKLPPVYSNAFSLRLANTCQGFDQAKVAKIEWLGSKINLQEIKNAFPQENVSFHYGKSFLVYKDGHKEPL